MITKRQIQAKVIEDLAKLRDRTCTNAAKNVLGALAVYPSMVVGYPIKSNPTALIGVNEGGHDFAYLHGRFIVDVWANDYYGERLVLDEKDPSDEAIIEILYGDKSTWCIVGKWNPRTYSVDMEKYPVKLEG